MEKTRNELTRLYDEQGYFVDLISAVYIYDLYEQYDRAIEGDADALFDLALFCLKEDIDVNETVALALLEKAAKEGHIRASQYLINIQKVANRAIKDCKDMLDLGKCKDVQFCYIYNNLHKLISKCQQVLRLNKEILASKGKSVVGFAVSTTQISNNSQLERVMRAIRILKRLKTIE